MYVFNAYYVLPPVVKPEVQPRKPEKPQVQPEVFEVGPEKPQVWDQVRGCDTQDT